MCGVCIRKRSFRARPNVAIGVYFPITRLSARSSEGRADPNHAHTTFARSSGSIAASAGNRLFMCVAGVLCASYIALHREHDRDDG